MQRTTWSQVRGHGAAVLSHKGQAWVIPALKLNAINFFGVLLRCFTVGLFTALKPVLALVRTDWGRKLGHLLVKRDEVRSHLTGYVLA